MIAVLTTYNVLIQCIKRTTVSGLYFVSIQQTNQLFNMGDSVDVSKNVEEITKALDGETIEGLVGKAAWRNEALPEANFTSLGQFEAALANWTQLIKQHLPERDFNLIGDYAQFYRDFTCQVTNTQKKKPILDFYRHYKGKINSNSLNCTGLSLTLLKNLQQLNSEFGSYFALVSCDDNIPVSMLNSAHKYDFESANAELRHVLICLKFSLSQCDRKGYVLMDSSYSVRQPIVVMSDEAYPHTGWFVPYRRETIEQRNYKLINSQHIQWEQRNINQSSGELETLPHTNLIYVLNEYLSYESVTQKKSLLMNVKYWVFRSGEGPVAALISLVSYRNLTILYRPEDDSSIGKEDFSIDQLDSEQVQNVLRRIAECSFQARSLNDESKIEEKFQELRKTLQEYRKALDDVNFSRDICALDEWILSKKQTID